MPKNGLPTRLMALRSDPPEVLDQDAVTLAQTHYGLKGSPRPLWAQPPPAHPGDRRDHRQRHHRPRQMKLPDARQPGDLHDQIVDQPDQPHRRDNGARGGERPLVGKHAHHSPIFHPLQSAQAR